MFFIQFCLHRSLRVFPPMSHSCTYPRFRYDEFSQRLVDQAHCQSLLIPTVVLQREPLLNKLVYFLRSNPKGVSDKTCEQDIVAGELSKESLDNYGTLLSALYLPVFQEQGNWGKSDTEHTHQFLQVCILLPDLHQHHSA